MFGARFSRDLDDLLRENHEAYLSIALGDGGVRQGMGVIKPLAFEALPASGALIVYDTIIDGARRRNVFGLLMSLCMLIETSGDFGYTGTDCVARVREAGFRHARVEHLAGPDSMVVGIK